MLHSSKNAQGIYAAYTCYFPLKGKVKKDQIIKVQMLHMLYNAENNSLDTINLPLRTIKHSVMLIDVPM